MSDTIKLGDYIVIQKQEYKKLYKLSKPNSNVTIGRYHIYLDGIEGCPYFSAFRIIPVGKSKSIKQYKLELVEDAITLKDEIEIKTSGADNRHITDDGRSQNLTKAEIDQLTSESEKAAHIVGTLISNSNTFHNKTEFSQEKYLKKKDKKYNEYIKILRPNLRIVAEAMYKSEPERIQHVRIDTLSQIITLSNIHCEGIHLLYDSGSNGLLAAALMNAIGSNTEGRLIHMHPGSMSQKQALLMMNFPEEQMNRCVSVNLYSVLRKYYEKYEINGKSSNQDTLVESEVVVSINATTNNCVSIENDVSENVCNEINSLKRKADDNNDTDGHKNKVQRVNDDETCAEVVNEVESDSKTEEEPKKPRWHYNDLEAMELLQNKVDSLIIVCKEDPHNIFMELLPLINVGRPFVIYYPVAEPLQNLYVVLKQNANVAALKLTCNWMRNYQILPERTHPEVMMNNQSGFLLTGYILSN